MSVIEQTNSTSPSVDTPDIEHIVCECSPDLALCGIDCSDMPWAEREHQPCVVCSDLEPLPCPRCGW